MLFVTISHVRRCKGRHLQPPEHYNDVKLTVLGRVHLERMELGGDGIKNYKRYVAKEETCVRRNS